MNPFGQQEIYETKLEKFSNLRELSKCQNSIIFSKFKIKEKNCPQGTVWRRRMQNLKKIEHLEVTENGVGKSETDSDSGNTKILAILQCP